MSASPASFADPVSFSITLEPGQIYTLNAESYVEAARSGSIGVTEYAPASAAISFSGSVPEPVSLSLAVPAMCVITRRRRRLARFG